PWRPRVLGLAERPRGREAPDRGEREPAGEAALVEPRRPPLRDPPHRPKQIPSWTAEARRPAREYPTCPSVDLALKAVPAAAERAARSMEAEARGERRPPRREGLAGNGAR